MIKDIIPTEIPNWATGHDDPRDWTASALGEDIQNLNIPNLSPVITTINQGNHSRTRSSCTIGGALVQACQCYSLHAHDGLLLEISDRANRNMWYDYRWQLSSQWANQTLKYFNEKYPEDKLLYITREYSHPDIKYLSEEKNFLLGCTYKGNTKYNTDYRSDFVLDETFFWASTYWHRVNFTKWYIQDQYFGWTANKYRIWEKGENMESLIENWVFYPTFYIFLKEKRLTKKTIAQIKTEQKEKQRAIMFVNSASLHWEYMNPADQVLLSEMVNGIRKKHNLMKEKTCLSKTLAIFLESMKWVIPLIPLKNRESYLKDLLSYLPE